MRILAAYTNLKLNRRLISAAVELQIDAKRKLDSAYYCEIFFPHTFLRVLYPTASVIPRHLATRVHI